MSVDVDQIVASNKFNHNSDGFKYFIGYQKVNHYVSFYLK